MPLPVGNLPWPLDDTATRARLRDYDAWYSGDPDRLGAVYQGRAEKRVRPSQRAKGVLGVIARWFWGTPTPVGESRRKLHVPLPADIATASSDLLFAKPPQIKFKNKATQQRWDQLHDLTRLRSRLHEAAEVQSALGGVYLRAHWDRAVAPHPLVSVVHADRAVPEWRGGRLWAVTFWQVLHEEAGKVVRHLQRYEMRSIGPGLTAVAVEENAVYIGREDNLGKLGNLDDYDETRGTTPTIAIGLPVLPVVHVPNMLPSREDRGSLAGRSDYEGVTALFDAIDEVLTSWMRDVRLAKARIIVPSQYLENLGVGQGAAFDVDRELYEGLQMPPTQTGGSLITLQQFDIRVEEHDASMMRLVRQAVGTAGFSASTFGLEEQGGGSEQTATEVNDRRNRTVLTKAKKTGYWTPELQEFTRALRFIDHVVFGSGVDALEVPEIEWPPDTVVDELKLAQTVQAWDVARAASTEVKVRKLHPEWSEPEVKAEVKRIRDEDGSTAVEPPPDDGLNNIAATGHPDGDESEEDQPEE